MAVCTNKWRKKNSIEEKSVHTEWNAFGHHRHNLYLYRLSEPTTNSGEMIVQAIKSAAFREVLLFFLYFEMWCIFISVVVLSLSVSYIFDLLSLSVSLSIPPSFALSPQALLFAQPRLSFFSLVAIFWNLHTNKLKKKLNTYGKQKPRIKL